jgi:hypothetical protein
VQPTQLPDYRYKIQLDADLRDWSGVPYKAQTKFRPCNKQVDGLQEHVSVQRLDTIVGNTNNSERSCGSSSHQRMG